MNPATIIREARSEGVNLALSPIGTIKASGSQKNVAKWLPVIREHKAEIIDVLKVGAGDTAIEPMTSDEEAEILAWLALIGETDTPTIGEVIDSCRANLEARRYFIGRAAVELARPGEAFTAMDTA